MVSQWQDSEILVSQMEEPSQDLQTRIKLLEEWVCALLIKNQTLRMGLQSEDVVEESPNYSVGSQRAAEIIPGRGFASSDF